jgi:formylglycine-generating enzyme required for sulfatase activity
MKKIVLGFTLAFLCGVCFAQQARVAIAPFTATSGNAASDAETIAEIFGLELQAKNVVRVYTRGNILAVMNENKFQMSDLSSDEKTASLGKAANADWVVRGQVQKLGNLIVVTASLLDVNTLEIMGGAPMYLNTIEEAAVKMDGFITTITQRISAGSGRTGAPPAQRAGQSAAPGNFVFVQGGTFQMGSTSGGDNDERPVHSVTVKSFYMGKYEVTQKEWVEIMGSNPSNWKGDNLPVERVTWYEVIEYCNKRSLREGLTPAYRGSGDSVSCDLNASGYRLPTEAEWEYAARGGAKGAYLTYEYSGSNSVESVGWYTENSGGRTHPVGMKLPNDLGLFDMSGNVWEWCWDWYGDYAPGARTDPTGPASGSIRVLRGGGWNSSAGYLRSAFRDGYTPSYRGSNSGFRLVRS